jgi:hypothetical protein
MGITSNDIAAQRAMLERGEEKRKADWKQADRERLRDTFAAAALTGLIASREWPIDSEEAAHYCYRVADAMLRERSRTGQDAAEVAKCTERENAAPEARARDADRHRTDKAVTRPGDGTGNTPSKAEIDAIECVVEDGRIASMSVYGVMRSLLVRLRPEWESQSYEESNEKRMNTTTNRDATPGEVSVQGEGTLTDAEREAIGWYAGYGRDGLHADTLRTLLERTKCST